MKISRWFHLRPFLSDKFRSHEDLERYLRSWGSFRDPRVYDFAGMVHLFRACLDNLIEHHPQHDFWKCQAEGGMVPETGAY